MLFTQRFWAGIADGTVTVTYRRWRRPQAVAGRRYRTGAGIIEVESIAVVDPAAITDGDARRAGHATAADLRAELDAVAARRGVADQPLYRLVFHRVDDPDPRAVLAADDELSAVDVAAIDARLDRLDRASSHGPWTAAALAAIAERPGVRAADLAASMGRETQPFKLDVRKLKALGLTHSLDVGYRLSPRGAAYRAATTRAGGDRGAARRRPRTS